MDDELHNEAPLDETPSEELMRLAQETIESQASSSDMAAVRTRCQRVIDLYARGDIKEPLDYFHSALVLLYGEKSAHFDLSRNFAVRAAQQGEARSWTVSAMALDRLLLSVGKPQRFGTQIIKKNGQWSVGEVDSDVSDLDRAFYGVPPLYVQQQRALQLQRQEQQDDTE